jgi:hypothetical protein
VKTGNLINGDSVARGSLPRLPLRYILAANQGDLVFHPEDKGDMFL